MNSNPQRLPCQQKTGFILVELLVVITIISILIALLLACNRPRRWQMHTVHEQPKQIGSVLFNYQRVETKPEFIN